MTRAPLPLAPDTPTASVASNPAARWAANALHLAGWLFVNALVALGLLALALLALGSFSMRGTMLHLANLALRFEAAPVARQDRFTIMVVALWGCGFALAALLRRASLGRLIERGSERR